MWTNRRERANRARMEGGASETRSLLTRIEGSKLERMGQPGRGIRISIASQPLSLARSRSLTQVLVRGVAHRDVLGVPITVLKTFKRLAALTTDDATIADALSLSPSLLEVSADRTSVKRRIAIPEDLNLDQRSIYAVRKRTGKGALRGANLPSADWAASTTPTHPPPTSSLAPNPAQPPNPGHAHRLDAARQQKGFPRTMTQTELETFFKTQGNVLSVRMRRFPNNKKEFKVRPPPGPTRPAIHTRDTRTDGPSSHASAGGHAGHRARCLSSSRPLTRRRPL